VDPHPDVGDVQHLGDEVREHREAQIPMGHGRPERALRGHVRIDVDPLVVVRGLGEKVDLLLVDRLPVARPELPLLRAFELLQGQLGRHVVASSRTRERSALRSTLPTGVSGNDGTRCTSRGYLSPPIRSLLYEISPSASTSWPDRSSTKATTSSPWTSSGRPITPAAATAGCSSSASSTSRGKTLKPPRMIRSFLRSTTEGYPSWRGV